MCSVSFCFSSETEKRITDWKPFEGSTPKRHRNPSGRQTLRPPLRILAAAKITGQKFSIAAVELKINWQFVSAEHKRVTCQEKFGGPPAETKECPRFPGKIPSLVQSFAMTDQ